MPEIIDKDGFKSYLFSSLQEFDGFFREELAWISLSMAQKLGVTQKLGITDTGGWDKISACDQGRIQDKIAFVWNSLTSQHGDKRSLKMFDVECESEWLTKQITRNFITRNEKIEPLIIKDASLKSKATTVQAQPEGKAEHRAIAFLGLASGAALTVHGAIATIKALKQEPRTQKKRNWQIALHTAEAIGGVALSWASLVALQSGHNPRGR